MYFKNLLGNSTIKNLLIKEVLHEKIPHAQLFSGAKGVGKLGMAIAFSTYLFCENKQNTESCGECHNCTKMMKLSHPDLHFFYPTIKTETVEKTSKSKKYFPNFQEALIQNYYLTLRDWQEHINGANKKASIRIADAATIQKIYNLKPYQGLYKIFIIWAAEKMNREASNSLLKIIEEPSPNTLFILITDTPNQLLTTIRSRAQLKSFNAINATIIADEIQKNHTNISLELIHEKIKHYNQDYGLILKNLENNLDSNESHTLFINWIRLCFLSVNKMSHIKENTNSAKRAVIESLIDWCAEIANKDRRIQIEFIKHSILVFRHAFLLNYTDSLAEFYEKDGLNFNIKNFANYVHRRNIFNIFSLLDRAHYYLDRYANSKILFLDLSFSLGKYLHQSK